MSRKPTGRPRGRQLGSGELGLGTHDEHTRLTLRIPHDLYTRLEAFAAGRHFHRGSPQLAACVRDAVEHYLTCPTKRQTANVPGNGHDTTRQTSKDTEEQEYNSGQTSNIPAEALDAMPVASVAIALQPAPSVVSGLAPVPADAARAERRALLLSAVPWEADMPHGSGISPAAIREATRIRKIDATNDLDELRKHGQVVKVSKGLYVRPGPAPVAKEE